jgi:Homeodomain-like domain
MPIKACSIVSQRVEFCRLAEMPGSNMRELCRRWMSRPQTGYKWPGRFRPGEVSGLEDRSRRPLSSPARTTGSMEEQVVAVHRDHPAWGGRKIRRVLQLLVCEQGDFG